METDAEKYNETVQPNTAFLNELRDKLPEFFTKDNSFDLEKFKNELKEKNTNELSEGYQLDFIGKDYARRQVGEMPNTVIVPDEKQNQGEGKNSKNLFFTGDNLEVLRHLQNNYQNKIDVIYIDPPYNTGSDGFVYPDSFEYSDDELKDMFDLDDDQVERLKSIQKKSNHSAWLTFMYPRLALAKKLLSSKGAIFISIDDNERDNLKLICDELFGESNFVDSITWNTRVPKNDNKGLGNIHQFVLVYVKSSIYNQKFLMKKKGIDDLQSFLLKLKENRTPIAEAEKKLKQYYKKNNFDRAVSLYCQLDDNYEPWGKINMSWPKSTSFGPDYDVYHPITKKVTKKPDRGWRWNEETFNGHVDYKHIIKRYDGSYVCGDIWFAKDENTQPSSIRYLHDLDDMLLRTVISLKSDGGTDVENLFGVKSIFSNPKPVKLIKLLLNSLRKPNGLYLDFFAGSSTTADAIMQLNAEDGGHRKFIMVQRPEKTYDVKNGKKIPTDGGKIAYNAGFETIDQISRERIRLASAQIKKKYSQTLSPNFDGSFKHYCVVTPSKQTLGNIEDFDPNSINLFTDMVDGFSSKSLNVPLEANGKQTILTTWLVRDGYTFEATVKHVSFVNYQADLIDGRLYLIDEGWSSVQTKDLLNKLGKNELYLQSVIIFGYSFNIAELRELEIGLQQLDSKVNLIKRY